jgi:probable rRNA maturation factor
MNPTPADSAEPIVSSADQYWISVQIGEAFGHLLDAGHLHALAVHTLQAEGHNEPLEVGITVTDDEEIHALNKEYLDHDYPTDVISFGAGSPLAERIADIEGDGAGDDEADDRVSED